jgi:plastocyanin
MKKYFAVVAILAIVSTLLLGCNGYGSPNTTPASTTATAPIPATTVTISNFAFTPATLTVKVGTTVVWTNKDSTAHTVTADDGTFNSGNVAPGATYSYTFAKAGTVVYHCAIHTYMKGTVIVQ